MEGLLFLFGLFLALGLFFLTASVLKLPTMGAAKAMLGTVKQERKAAKTLETYFMILAVRLSGFIRMDAYKRSRMQNVLKASGMNMTPEVYQAYALVKSGAVLLGAIPCMFLFPLLVPVVVVLALLLYFKENQKADETLKAKREEIEGELPRMVATMEQELKASRNVIGMLERFKGNAGPALTGELDILLADMRSSNYEAALTRFEARLNSPMLSDVVRGLIGVLRGDDSTVYFQMLAHDFKQIELQRLKAQAQKIPPKIRVFSFVMLVCFLLTYLAIICYVALESWRNVLDRKEERMRSHRLWRALSERRGEGYVDVIVLVLCAVMVLALAMRVLPVFIQKQQLDTFATELVREAEVSGRVGAETSRRAAVLSEKTGLHPDILWSSHGRIQLNEEVTVILTMDTNIGLFGEFASFPVTLRAQAAGKSEVYWK